MKLTMPKSTADLLHGTLDAMILKTLSWGARHGYGIARWLEDTTGDTLRIEEGSLYPALYRPGAPGLDRSRMGRIGSQSQGQVLSSDSRRP